MTIYSRHVRYEKSLTIAPLPGVPQYPIFEALTATLNEPQNCTNTASSTSHSFFFNLEEDQGPSPYLQWIAQLRARDAILFKMDWLLLQALIYIPSL